MEFWHEGTYLASYQHDVNTTRQFTVSEAYPYGEYEIKAVAGDSVTTIFLSVVDVGGWLPTSFPYQRSHKNVDYTFYANGTIKAENSEDVMFIDLSTLRYLKNLYDLDVDVYYNSMNFRVRFYKTGIVDVNFVFSFIHTGCKFVVEGELDQPREFSFDIANPQRLRNLVDSVKQGNLIFDYSDLRRAAHAFSYSNGTLTLSLPQSFSFDPTIFSDGFESGDLLGWDVTIGTPTATDAQQHCGTYSMSVSGAGTDYVYEGITEQTTVNMRLYFRVNSAMGNYATWNFMQINKGATAICRMSLYHGSGSEYTLKIFRWYPGFSTLAQSITFTEGEWYRFEMMFIRDAAAGAYYGWFDDAEEGSPTLSETGLDTSGISGCDRVIAGNMESGTVDYNIDCVMVADEYIGPEEEGGQNVFETFEETITVTTSGTEGKELGFSGGEGASVSTSLIDNKALGNTYIEGASSSTSFSTLMAKLFTYGASVTLQIGMSEQREGAITMTETIFETCSPSATLYIETEIATELEYATRGEILAAAMIATLIIVPIILFIIFAARRKR